MKWKTFSMLIAALWLWGSCNDDEINRVENPVQTGDEITFGSSLPEGVETRTSYGEAVGTPETEGYYPINWVDGDEIAIYCPQASLPASKLVNYRISPNKDDLTRSDSVTKVNENEAGLQWGDTDMHRFYGFYPASAVKGTEEDGRIMGSIPVFQPVKSWEVITESGKTTYRGKPDMKLAYMWAFNEVSKEQTRAGKDVPLVFHPLVTVLEITVNGPSKDQMVEVSNITIQGVSGNIALAGDFECYIAGTDANGNNKGTCTPLDNGTVTNRIAISCSRNNQPIQLHQGDKIVVQAFIIPNETSISTQQVSITVTTTSGAARTKTLETDEILPHKVNFVSLPALNPNDDVNYWMSDLDPNIYVTELSLPGSKMSMLTNANRADIVFQNASIAEQLQAGVRAFIFHTQRMYGGEIRISVNGKALDIPLTQSLQEIADFLNTAEYEGKQECAFVLVTYNSGNGSENDWMKSLQQTINDCARNSTYRIFNGNLSPNTTLGDVGGKIIVKANYNSADMIAGVGTAPMLYTAWDSAYVEGGLPMTWSDPNSAKAFTWLYQEVTSVFDADRNEVSGTSAEATKEEKRQYITEIFQKSVDAYKNNDAHDTWFMNDLGGYYYYKTEEGILGWREEEHFEPERLATDMNNLGVQLLQNRTENAALGLIYMNFADRDANSGQQYESDWLIQTVIDNNFKFALRKKTNATSASQTATTKTINPDGWDE